MESIKKYKEYDPYAEAILRDGSGSCIVIDRYPEGDYSAWWTDERHLKDETYGACVRGSLSCILDEIKPKESNWTTRITFADIPITGSATATHDGKVIWNNHLSGDYPPDIATMYVRNLYAIDGEIIIDLVK